MCMFCDNFAGRFVGNEPRLASDGPSRRLFLKASAAAGAGAAASPAFAQSTIATDDAELAKLRGSRRVCLKGGLILTMDRQVGDFAEGDVLLEDGKIRAIGAKLDVSPDN